METEIACGATYPNQEMEERTQAMRRAGGFRTDGGCGKVCSWIFVYRCVECGRFMHRDCILRHFAETGDDKQAS